MNRSTKCQEVIYYANLLDAGVTVNFNDLPGDVLYHISYFSQLRKNKEDNLLDLIPEITCRWEKTQEGKIYLLVPRFRSPLLRKISLKFGRSEWVLIILDEKGT